MAFSMVISSAYSISLADWNSGGDPRYSESGAPQLSRKISCGSFAFHGGIGGDDDFIHLLILDPAHQV